MLNPFVYSSPVSPDSMLDRDDEARHLLERAVAGHNSRVVAPRRYGKTSLAHRLARDITDEGWLAVYVNFFGVLTLGDVADRIDRAYGERLEGALASWWAGVRRVLRPAVSIGVPPLAAQAQVAVPAEQPLLERLALPRRLHEKSGRRVLVVFDEFQDVLTAGDRVDAVIRSEIEHHGTAASYVFAGSHVGMMRELFTDQRRGFYGQAGAVALEPLAPEDVAEHVDAAFRATGKEVGAALGPLLDAGEGHPQRSMLLAHWLWELTPARGTADESVWAQADDRVMDVEIRDELRGLWTGLPAGQRKLLALVASGEPLFGRAAHDALGLPRGGGLRKTAQALVDRGDIAEAPDQPSGYRVVDPLLRRWILQGRPSAT